MLPLFREKLWREWIGAKAPSITPIPVDKAQLLGRVAGDSFDGGRTATWLSSLPNPHWMAVRDQATGHTIHVVSDRGSGSKSLQEDLKKGLKIMGWLSKRPITWYWWDQPWSRRMPAGVDPGRDHVNGGWAVPGVPEVHVYRREEAHKVMIHECIHALTLDVAVSLVSPVLHQFETALDRRLWPHLGEAYTEFYAEFLWSIASSNSLERARDAWNYQLNCSEKQAAQVWARIHDATKDEDTNVFAYYVLKWVLMQHTEEALLQKNASVPRWFSWWLAIRPALDQKAKALSASEFKELPMGMTCK
jgi:hypothetical protein